MSLQMDILENNLTDQQKRFCDEYLVSFNAYRSAVCAGYSMNTARKAELLHLPKIQAYLKAGMAKNAERLQVSHDMILRELAKIAFSNMGNYYDDTATLKPMSLLTSDEKAAISHYQIMDSTDEYGNRVGELSRIKLHNKMSALDKIARHVGFYCEKKVVSGELPVASLGQEPEVGSLKQEAFVEEAQESRTKNQDEESFVVNNEGELVNEAVVEETVIRAELNGTSATTEKILTISPLSREARIKNQESREKKYAVVSSRGSYSFKSAAG
ncbi:MAG: terminase small subunit [Mucilaginibacter sp.]|uniref:terminase small subunit n=1 Tax=Mucilaginibacter sp. TaxID=1882438 RepID=UPI00326658A3